MSNSARWSVALLVVVVALVVAMWPRHKSEPVAQTPQPGSGTTSTAITSEPPATLAPLRDRAALSTCPAPSGAATSSPSPLDGITLTCLADGSPVNLRNVTAGTPVVLNFWAYWCGPCTDELPAMAKFAQQAGPAVRVLTVHSDPHESAALSRLTDLGVHVAGVQDGDQRLAAALRLPAVVPTTVLIRADGTVAATLPVPFTSAEQISEAVSDKLGVRT